MGNFTWGSTDLIVLDGSYIPPHPRSEMEEIELIPTVGNENPNSVLQMGGRNRMEVNLKGLLFSFDELNAFYADDMTKEIKTFTDPYGLSKSMIVKEFELGTWKHNQEFEYSLKLWEA